MTVRLDLEPGRTLVMGIVNRTPDSFYDGGRMDLAASVDYALGLIDEGADVLDLGAIKAGPGEAVDETTEMERLLPLVDALAECPIPLSVETTRAAVARAALAAGASVLNDVTGLADEDLATAAAEHDARLVVMHHGDQIRSRPRHPRYEDVVGAVLESWAETSERARAAGVPADHLLFDPGLDFGKTTYHSLEIMRRLSELTAGERPVLVAPSRKDVVGETLGLPPDQRLEGTLALVALSAAAGAAVVRVHDVAAAVQTVRMVEAVQDRRPPLSPVRGLWD